MYVEDRVRVADCCIGWCRGRGYHRRISHDLCFDVLRCGNTWVRNIERHLLAQIADILTEIHSICATHSHHRFISLYTLPNTKFRIFIPAKQRFVFARVTQLHDENVYSGKASSHTGRSLHISPSGLCGRMRNLAWMSNTKQSQTLPRLFLQPKIVLT